jgi:menaquinone-dependent protoporphyrinogen oxidase
MRVLVTAASKHGATAEIAAAIGAEFADKGVSATVLRPADVTTLEGFDGAVIGSAVYAGHWLQPAKDLVARHAAALQRLPVWIFSSGPIGDPLRPEEDPVNVTDLMEATGAREHRVFAGKLDKHELNFGERAIMVAVRASEGDFRDWDAIRDWTDSIIASLGGASPAE